MTIEDDLQADAEGEAIPDGCVRLPDGRFARVVQPHPGVNRAALRRHLGGAPRRDSEMRYTLTLDVCGHRLRHQRYPLKAAVCPTCGGDERIVVRAQARRVPR